MNKPNMPAPPLAPLRYPLPPGVRPLTPYKRRPQPLIDLAAHDKRVLAEAAAKADAEATAKAQIKEINAALDALPDPPAPTRQDDEPQNFDPSEFPGAEPRRPGRPRKTI